MKHASLILFERYMSPALSSLSLFIRNCIIIFFFFFSNSHRSITSAFASVRNTGPTSVRPLMPGPSFCPMNNASLASLRVSIFLFIFLDQLRPHPRSENESDALSVLSSILSRASGPSELLLLSRSSNIGNWTFAIFTLSALLCELLLLNYAEIYNEYCKRGALKREFVYLRKKFLAHYWSQ